MVLFFILLLFFALIIVLYQAKQTMNHYDKRIFDGVSTAVILCLGFRLLAVLKDLAKIARWRILSNRSFEAHEVVFIFNADSLMKTFRMMTQSSLNPSRFLICLVWMLVNIGAPISLAVLPLFVLLKSGYNSSGITVSQGYVAVPRLDCFYRHDMAECEENHYPGDATIAHTYGKRRTFGDLDCDYQSFDDIYKGPQTCLYFIRNDRREFTVRYADSNPTDLINAYPYYGAKRIITIAATNCNGTFNVTDHDTVASSDGIDSDFAWPFENSTGTYPLSIPRSILAAYSTTYVWNDTELPPSSTSEACGPRCVVLYALRDMHRGPKHEISIFQCHVTISPMANVKDPAHVLSDSMARTAAASIALSGRWRPDGSRFRNFQLYQASAEWAARLDDSPEDIGSLMAEFAASVLATMAQENPPTIVPGSLPTLGYQIDVEWTNTIALIASLAVAYLLIILLMVWLARPVIVMDESYLLLKGLTETASDGDELHPLALPYSTEHYSSDGGLTQSKEMTKPYSSEQYKKRSRR